MRECVDDTLSFLYAMHKSKYPKSTIFHLKNLNTNTHLTSYPASAML